MRLHRSLAAIFGVVLGAIAALAAFPVHAQDISLSGGDNKVSFAFEPIYMRHTNVITGNVRNAYWQSPRNSVGFIDSLVFHHAGSLTVYDTTATIMAGASKYPWPPGLGQTTQNALVDTNSVPWIVLRVKQDTLSAGYTSNSILDSLYITPQYSYDGITWLNTTGTPTHRFSAAFVTAGADGSTSAASLIGLEAVPGEDAIFIPIRCHPSQATSNVFIANRTLCLCGGYIRFLVGGDHTGQFTFDIGSWHNQ